MGREGRGRGLAEGRRGEGKRREGRRGESLRRPGSRQALLRT